MEIKTATNDHIIHFFAFFVGSSSHHEKIYINPAPINAITDKTATYFIISATMLHIKSSISSLSLSHHGNQEHSMSISANVWLIIVTKYNIINHNTFIIIC